MSEGEEVPNPSLIGMITKPSQQFDRIYEKPLIWRAIVIEMVLSTAGLLLAKTSEASIVNTLGITAIIAIAVTGPFIRVGILSALFMLSSTFAPKSRVTFKQLGSLNTYISFIVVMNIIVNAIAIVIVGKDAEVLFTNMKTIINLIFAIWITILTAFGLDKVADFPKQLAWFSAILFILIANFYNEI